MNFESVLTVNKEFDKDTFLRQLLINLGKNHDTPSDVVNASFGEVKESIKEVILCSAEISGVCTASIGYDREEPYTAYETYKEKIGDQYVERQRAVVKYRTVTDWQPYTTQYSDSATDVEENVTNSTIPHSAISLAMRTLSNESLSVEGDAVVNSDALNRVIRNCKIHVEIRSVKLPGDRKKDEKYQSSHQIDSLSCYRLPFYEVTFNYDGKEYNAYGFACGDIHVLCDAPKEEIKETNNPEEEITIKAEEHTRLLAANTKLAWSIFFIALAVSAAACFLLKFCWLWPIATAIFVYACITNKKYNEEYKQSADEFALNYAKSKSQSQAQRMHNKIDALNKALSNRGYATLSESETPTIDGESQTVIDKNMPKVAPKKSIKKKAILCGLLVLVLIIGSFVVRNKTLHSPRQIDVEITNKTVEYDPNASGYTYGCYYIYLDFEVEAKKTGVEYVDLRVYIEDKQGNELGYVNASLSDLRIESGDSKNVTVTLKENQPERNDFFTSLYNADFSELEFEYEIGSIRFDDGEYYFNDSY